MAYDSTEDTKAHIERVQALLAMMAGALISRARIHDKSKLEEPEKSGFDEFTPKLRETTYGSPEYEKLRAGLGEVLKHHYAHNRHHPEHHPSGVDDMNLLDIVEMFCDWKAATERHADGDLGKSITHNTERFALSEQLAAIFRNTKRDMAW